MNAHPVHCPAPHPTVPGWVCNARLFDAVPGTVDLLATPAVPPGCVAVKCPRCGAVYVVCARAA